MSPDEDSDNDSDRRERSDLAAASSPLESDRYAWPTLDVDPVEKMRALAANLPWVAVDETVFDVPFDSFWRFIEDLETNTPRIESTVNKLEILDRYGDRLRLKARSPIGVWDEFDAVLRPGFCVMQGRSGQIGMAARPESETTTRYFHFEGTKSLGRIARPFFAWNIRQDFRRLRKLLTTEI
jgi:hypothetical protein